MSNQDKIAEARRKLLEKRLKGKAQATGTTSAPTIPKRPDDSAALAASGQERLWVLQQLQPQSGAYNMPHSVRIRGALDVARLETSLQQVIRRHPALRTSFVMQGGQLIQQVHDSVHVPITIEDVASEAELESHIRSVLSQPFNLADAPLMRAVLLHLDDNVHVLVLSIHHIVSDEWSIDLLWKEAAAFYSGDESNIPDLTVDYTDYAHWQRQQSYDKQLDYWRDTLSGDLPLLQLPADKPRPAVQTFNGKLKKLTLSSDLSSALQQLSSQAGSTLFMTLFAAFNVLLHRYTGQDDILVGTPIANRKQAEIENVIGFFLNTVVIRSDFTDDTTFTAYLDDMRQQALKAIANSDVPFNQVVETIKPQRDPSYNPIFQAMFVYQDGQSNHPQLPDLELETLLIPAEVSKFDVTLFALSNESGIEIGLEYNTDLFSDEQMARFVSHFETLTQSIVATPDATISALNILPDDERQQILEFSTSATHDYDHDALVHDLIAAHPADSVAIQDEYGTMTYRELNERANQVAHYLRSLGVDADVPVGLCVERSSDMLVGILAILKAGGAYVPIDPDYPEERVNYMLADAGMSILLTQDMLSAQFTGSDATVVALDTNPRIDMQPTTPPDINTTSDNLAYIIYTSGSTGKPKGVRISHRNLVHSTTARYTYYPNQSDRFLLLSSYAFDSSIVGIFWTLCAGGTLCLPPHQGERDVTNIARLISDYDVTHLLALPSLYQILLDFAKPEQLQSLNTVMVAGEACPINLVQLHYAMLPDCRLYNEYGPTEGTVWSTAWEIPPDAQTILIGKTIPNMQTYILDANRQPVPIGVQGELYIGGDGIAQGYHNRPELTAERFIDNPFADGRIYRTGDLARFLPDGNIEFFGRADFQVKISGYRIELSEIETSLMQHDAVREAIVIPMDKQTTGNDKSPINLDDLAAQITAQNAATLLTDIEQLSDDEVNNILKALLGGD